MNWLQILKLGSYRHFSSTFNILKPNISIHSKALSSNLSCYDKCICKFLYNYSFTRPIFIFKHIPNLENVTVKSIFETFKTSPDGDSSLSGCFPFVNITLMGPLV